MYKKELINIGGQVLGEGIKQGLDRWSEKRRTNEQSTNERLSRIENRLDDLESKNNKRGLFKR